MIVVPRGPISQRTHQQSVVRLSKQRPGPHVGIRRRADAYGVADTQKWSRHTWDDEHGAPSVAHHPVQTPSGPHALLAHS